MGAGGLNGELRTYSSDIDSQLRCNIQRFSREVASSSINLGTSNTNDNTNTSSPASFSPPASYTEQENSEQNMTCEDCGTSFSIFKRKNNCSGCKKTFCSLCFNQGAENAHRLSGKHCLTCRALASPILYKEQLMLLKIKNLQKYLRSVDISTSHCKEKRDLVDLIIKNAKSRQSAFSHFSSQNASNQNVYNQGGDQSQRAPMVQADIGIPPGPFGVPHEISQGFGQRPSRPVQQQNNNGERWGEVLPGMPQYSSNDDSTNHSTAASLQQEKSSKQTTLRNSRTIDDLKNIDQVDKLSVKELKHILTANFVDYTGCCEKQELLDRVRQLWKSKQIGKLKAENSESVDGVGEDDELCKICMDAAIDCVLLECGHMVTCTSCGRLLVDCPICRQNIARIVHVFRS